MIVILGPTGTGKSEVGINLAHQIGGEIINADSRQIYRGMTIGTAKPNLENTKSVPIICSIVRTLMKILVSLNSRGWYLMPHARYSPEEKFQSSLEERVNI